MKRRTFLQGSCAAACAGLFPGALWFSSSAMASGSQHPILVYVFLRGGIDGLHLVVPYAGPERTSYNSIRNAGSNLVIPENRLRRINAQYGGGGSTEWALHPRMGGERGDGVEAPPKWLHRRFNQGQVAIVHSCGISTLVNRSHFDAQQFWDLGTPGSLASSTGWLTRYLQAKSPLPPATLTSAFGFSGTAESVLRGATNTLVVNSPQDFSLLGSGRWRFDDTGIAGHKGALSHLMPLWTGGDQDHIAYGRRTAEALESLRAVDFRLFHPVDRPDGYQPSGGAIYPNVGLGTQLRNLAQLIKLDSGLMAATINYGGWDNHNGIGMPNPGNANHFDPFGNRVEDLSRALDAFYTDLESAQGGSLMSRVIVAVVSEFGRRVRPNASAGTDHGYGNVMMALGGGVQGGLHGEFTGLDGNSLKQGQDIDVSTDYRQILAEAMIKRGGLSASSMAQIFPSMGSYDPLNIF